MKDNENLIAEAAQKQAEIQADIEAMMQQGGANLPEPEMLKAKHAALAAHFEEMRKKHEELQPKVEELLNVKKEGERK